MEIRSIANKTWLKNWVMNCGVSFCSLYGDLYTKEMIHYLDKKFQTVVLLFEKGTSTQYLIAEEQKNVVQSIVASIQKDPQRGKQYCEEVKKQTSHIMQLMDEIKKKTRLQASDLLELQKALYLHVPPNLLLNEL